MIYCVEKESRLIYEAKAVGNYLIVRPAQVGLEHMIERLSMLDFNNRFDFHVAKFLIPDQLTNETEDDDICY